MIIPATTMMKWKVTIQLLEQPVALRDRIKGRKPNFYTNLPKGPRNGYFVLVFTNNEGNEETKINLEEEEKEEEKIVESEENERKTVFQKCLSRLVEERKGIKERELNPILTQTGLKVLQNIITRHEEDRLIKELNKDWSKTITRPTRQFGWDYDHRKRYVNKIRENFKSSKINFPPFMDHLAKNWKNS